MFILSADLTGFNRSSMNSHTKMSLQVTFILAITHIQQGLHPSKEPQEEEEPEQNKAFCFVLLVGCGGSLEGAMAKRGEASSPMNTIKSLLCAASSRLQSLSVERSRSISSNNCKKINTMKRSFIKEPTDSYDFIPSFFTMRSAIKQQPCRW